MLCNKRPLQWEAHTPQEKASTQQQSSSTAKNNFFFLKKILQVLSPYSPQYKEKLPTTTQWRSLVRAMKPKQGLLLLCAPAAHLRLQGPSIQWSTCRVCVCVCVCVCGPTQGTKWSPFQSPPIGSWQSNVLCKKEFLKRCTMGTWIKRDSVLDYFEKGRLFLLKGRTRT